MPNVPAGAAFFAAVRPLYGGKLAQEQVDGLTAIIGQWNVIGDGDDRRLAYILGTAFHETGRTMQPVREAFGKSDADTKAKLTRAFNAGKLKSVKKDYWSGGYFGRGYVQLTHRANYAKAGESLGLDLVNNPSLALDAKPAAAILIRGCLEGWFTKKKLSDYITDKVTDYRNARRVVNGLDRADDIADYAETFEAAIRAERHATNEVAVAAQLQKSVNDALTQPEGVAVPDTPAPPVVVANATPNNNRLLAVIGAVFMALVAGALSLFGQGGSVG